MTFQRALKKLELAAGRPFKIVAMTRFHAHKWPVSNLANAFLEFYAVLPLIDGLYIAPAIAPCIAPRIKAPTTQSHDNAYGNPLMNM